MQKRHHADALTVRLGEFADCFRQTQLADGRRVDRHRSGLLQSSPRLRIEFLHRPERIRLKERAEKHAHLESAGRLVPVDETALVEFDLNDLRHIQPRSPSSGDRLRAFDAHEVRRTDPDVGAGVIHR